MAVCCLRERTSFTEGIDTAQNREVIFKIQQFLAFLLTIVPVPEVINIPHCINREVVNHTARSDERVSLGVDVRVTFPWLTGTKLYKT